MSTAYPAVPLPRSEGGSCACCADMRADMTDASADVFDAFLVGGSVWVEMTRQEPLHPSMQRLLDCRATVDHRHRRGSHDTTATTALDTDLWAAGSGGNIGSGPRTVGVD